MTQPVLPFERRSEHTDEGWLTIILAALRARVLEDGDMQSVALVDEALGTIGPKVLNEVRRAHGAVLEGMADD